MTRVQYSIEIPRNSDDYYDVECSKCGRRLRFTLAFFRADFKFPMELKCAKCHHPFTVDMKKVTTYVKYDKDGNVITPGKRKKSKRVVKYSKLD